MWGWVLEADGSLGWGGVAAQGAVLQGPQERLQGLPALLGRSLMEA